MNRQLSSLSRIFLLALISSLATLGRASEPPNFVFILVDDLGYMDVSPNNPQTFYETPNLRDDLGERHDLAEQHSERVDRMRSKLHDWYRDVDAKFLRAKENGPQPWKPS